MGKKDEHMDIDIQWKVHTHLSCLPRFLLNDSSFTKQVHESFFNK